MAIKSRERKIKTIKNIDKLAMLKKLLIKR